MIYGCKITKFLLYFKPTFSFFVKVIVFVLQLNLFIMKKILIMCLLVCFAGATMAQGQVESAKKQSTQVSKEGHSKCGSQDCQAVMKLKKEYLETHFKLDEKQKEPFWEAFNAYAKAEFEAFQKSREIMREAGIDHHVAPDSIQYLSDDQIMILYKTRLETRRQLLEAESKFLQSISKCLSAKQVNEYYQLDRKFKRSAANHKKDGSCKEAVPAEKGKCPQKCMEAAPSKSAH